LRRLPFLFFALVSLCCAAGGFRTLAAQTTANWTIEGVLSMMDKSAQDFHTLTADIEHIKYTAVVKDTSAETGQISYAAMIRCASISRSPIRELSSERRFALHFHA